LFGFKRRGLHGVQMITSGDHEGLKALLTAAFHGVAWNRCHFQLQLNVAANVPKLQMRAAVAEDIRNILAAPLAFRGKTLAGSDGNKIQRVVFSTITVYAIDSARGV
jgi:transposase-like protein